MKINIEINIMDGDACEVKDFIEKLNALCGTDKVYVSNFAESTSVSEQKPKKSKRTIDEIWGDILIDLPRGFEKSGIGKYTCNSKLAGRNIEISIKDKKIVLYIPDPDGYSEYGFYRYTDKTSSSFNMAYMSELLSQTVEDLDVRIFIERYFTNREEA